MHTDDNEIKRNGSGYVDLPAYQAIKNITHEEQKVSLFIKTIKNIANLCGYEILNRIEIRDKKTGRVWK